MGGITTVGYGDVVPKDTIGRLVASIVMINGIAFITMMTALLTSSFISRRTPLTGGATGVIAAKLDQLSSRIDAIDANLEDIRTAITDAR